MGSLLRLHIWNTLVILCDTMYIHETKIRIPMTHAILHECVQLSTVHHGWLLYAGNVHIHLLFGGVNGIDNNKVLIQPIRDMHHVS